MQRTLAERWDGHAWHIVGSPNAPKAPFNSLDMISCVSASACEALGTTGRAAVASTSIITESWNGRSWRMVPVQKPGPATTLNAVSCLTAKSCMTVGTRNTASGAQAVAERWNGARWQIVTTRDPAAFTFLAGVSCPAPGNCTAVGSSGRSRLAVSTPLVEHWNGRQWSVVTVKGPRNSALASLSCPTTTACTAIGATLAGDGGLLVADLSRSRWTFTKPTAPKDFIGPAFEALSCSAPRVCTALVHYENPAEELSDTTAARGASGGWSVAVPATDVSPNTLAGVSCRPVACTVVGGLNTTDGQGDPSGMGTTFAERGTGNHLVAQTTPNP